MGANESIAVVEIDLRGLIRDLLAASLGAEWITLAGLKGEAIDRARVRIDAEAKRRPGVQISTEVIDYLQFYDLKTIISKHWQVFAPVLGPKLQEFSTYFDRLNDLRDADAHNRQLLPFERDLLAGIAGEIRNRITIYRSEMGPKREYYPRIESITDNFGTRYTSGSALAGPVFTNLEIEVGTELEFSCAGWDPEGRELTWVASKYSSGIVHEVDKASGTEVRLRLNVGPEDVGESWQVTLRVKSSGQYHRHSGEYDDWVIFWYDVAPPQGAA